MFSAVTKEIGSMMGTHDATKCRKSGKGLTCFPLELGQCECGQIVEIDVSNNAIPHIPASVAKLAALTALNLSYNQLTSLPEEFGQLVALVHLDLSFNNLQILPETVCHLRSLKFVNLRSTQLSELPDGICEMSSLTYLNVKGNKLTRLPVNITQLTGLLELDLSDNMLAELPEHIGKMTSLVRLNATSNEISHIPESIKNCSKLVVVRIAANKLEYVPHEVGFLPQLSWFSMASCPAALAAPAPHEEVEVVTMDALRLGKVLKAGANGVVHWAKMSDKQVVVKVFKEEVGLNGCASDEIALTASLDHPNCTRALALINHPQLALVMEHFRGKPLESESRVREDPSSTGEQRLRKNPTSPKPREWRVSNGSAGVATVSRGYAIQVASDVASGLRYLHTSLQICHGDLHPHNVLAAPDGAACISDFGSAFRYHPEERRVWEPVDVRGLGVVLRSLEERTVQPEEDLAALSTSCLTENLLDRPDLDAVISRLQRMQYGKFCE